MTKEGSTEISLTKPVFVISLDMELAWGLMSNPEDERLTLLRNDPQEGRGTVSFLLELFERYNIPATWAVVGHLFFDSDGAEESVHQEMPQFKEGAIDWVYYSDIRRNHLYCGKDIVQKILASSIRHEIGLHGFFHIPFSECSREVARAEVEQGIRAANKLGITPKSFVFPKNRIGHIDVLKENGIQIYRGKNKFHQREADQKLLVWMVNGAIDKIRAAPVSVLRRDGIWELPSSTGFYHPRFRSPFPWRARLGLYQAIRARKVFHIWLHPWNLLLYERLREDLERFLALVAQKRDQGKIEVMTMGEIVTSLTQSSS
jgi:peptidoglycan/xylan/chitin deacetylase (PgdA/CDA1 family)